MEIERVFRQSEWLMLDTVGDPEKLRRIANELIAEGFQETSILNWAAELESQKRQLQCIIDANGGTAEVWSLVDLQGRPINARVVNRRCHAEWEILDAFGHATGKRAPYRPRRRSVLARLGYSEVKEIRLAVAMIVFGVDDTSWANVEAVAAPKLVEDEPLSDEIVL